MAWMLPVSSTSIEKSTPLQAKKSWGGQLSHYVISIEGCLGLHKNLGSRLVNRRNTILKRFLWFLWFLLMFYLGKLGKTSKITCFRDLNPVNGVFWPNFVPYPMGLVARDFLIQILKIEIFVLWNRGTWKDARNGHFWPFAPKMTYFDQIDSINDTIDQIYVHKPDCNNF